MRTRPFATMFSVTLRSQPWLEPSWSCRESPTIFLLPSSGWAPRQRHKNTHLLWDSAGLQGRWRNCWREEDKSDPQSPRPQPQGHFSGKCAPISRAGRVSWLGKPLCSDHVIPSLVFRSESLPLVLSSGDWLCESSEERLMWGRWEEGRSPVRSTRGSCVRLWISAVGRAVSKLWRDFPGSHTFGNMKAQKSQMTWPGGPFSLLERN